MNPSGNGKTQVIDALWVYVQCQPGQERIVIMQTEMGNIPMIFLDEKTALGEKRKVHELAVRTKLTAKLIKLTSREEIEVLVPITIER